MELKKERFVRFYSGEKQQGGFLGGKADSSNLEKSSSGYRYSSPLLNSDGRYKVNDTLKFGRSKVYPEDHNRSWRKRILDPGSDIVIQWNRIFIISCLLALFVDPLYFFLPIIQGTKESSCVKSDLNLRIVVTIFRTIADFFYLLHVFIKFRTAYIAPNTRVFGKGELVMDPKKIALRYLRSDFFVDLIATLPLPQMVIWFIIPATRSQHATIMPLR